jgi:DNA-damage-inducible protein J
MMVTKLVTFKMEEEVKKEFDLFCSEVGINMSSAFNMFAKTAIRERRIPFEIAADPFYSEKNLQTLRRSIKEADVGDFTAHTTADDFDALVASL